MCLCDMKYIGFKHQRDPTKMHPGASESTWERPGTENSARDLESPLEPYIAYVCEGSGQEINMQPGTRHEVD